MKIYLIRHCEKPDDPDDPTCSEKGYRRAEAWATFFTSPDFEPQFTPDNVTIFAAAPYDKKNRPKCQRSQRMLLTAQPLAQKLGIPINVDYCVGDEKKLAKFIRENVATPNVLIVWGHDEIPKIINKFVAKPIDKWPGKLSDLYNIVFRLTPTDEDDDPEDAEYDLSYNCYLMNKNELSCDKKTKKWVAIKPDEFLSAPKGPNSSKMSSWSGLVIAGVIAVLILALFFGMYFYYARRDRLSMGTPMSRRNRNWSGYSD